MLSSISEGEVIHPAADESIQCLADLLKGLSATAPGLASHFAAQSLQTFAVDANA
jgi:hypothetical protein